MRRDRAVAMPALQRFAAGLTLLCAGAPAVAAVNPPQPLATAPIAPPVQSAQLDFSDLPPPLAGLRLDALFGRGGHALPQDCDTLVPLAYELSRAEPQRPGPPLVLALCAEADGATADAAVHWQQLRERAAAALAAPGVWQGDIYYYAVGALDAVALTWARDPRREQELIAETLEASADGHRLMNLLWLRADDGRVQRLRVDITPSAERVMDYLREQSGAGPAGDTGLAMAGAMTLELQAGQIAADPRALVGRARVAERNSFFGGIEQASKDLQRAAVQDDTFGRYAYAEWLLRRDAAADPAQARDLLRGAAERHLPEAQLLLSLLCARPAAGCAKDEAAVQRAAAERAYGEADVALQEYELLQRLPQLATARQAEAALQRAVRRGSLRALGVRAYALQRADSAGTGRSRREIAALLREAAGRGLAYAVEELAEQARAAAQTPAQQQAALAELKRAATLGSARAAAQLGVSYALGRGVARDAQQALRWHRLAAERGHPAGQYNLASALQRGDGVAADAVQARLWFLRSALQGHMASLAALGDIYLSGEHVKQDSVRALRLYEAAAQGGHANSQYLYATALWQGDGVTQDRAAALRWFEQAAAQGVDEAEVSLALAAIAGEGVPHDPAAAIARLERCLARGARTCRRALAELFSGGPTELRDYARAFALYEQAAAENEAHALNALGWHHAQGLGTPADPARAHAYYLRCDGLAGAGADECINNLAGTFENGAGVARDPARAVALYRRARELGSAYAACNLGKALRDGFGATPDPAAAADLIAEAAAAGIAHCQLLQARRLLRDGDAAADEAMAWLRKAASGGEKMADVAIVHLLLRATSPLHDEAAGLAHAQRCAAAGNPVCLGEAGRQLQQRADTASQARGRALTEQAAAAGDRYAALRLGMAAYEGQDQPRDEAAALRWLTLAGPYQLAPARLARLQAKAGDIAAARRLLVEQVGNGNALARFQLIGLCTEAQQDCGAEPATPANWLAKAEAEGEAYAAEMLNTVAWAVATDALAPAADAERLIAMNTQARHPLDGDWEHRDTWAALQARAGRTAEACRLQQQVIQQARAAKAETDELAQLRERQAAYCRGGTWDRFE